MDARAGKSGRARVPRKCSTCHASFYRISRPLVSSRALPCLVTRPSASFFASPPSRHHATAPPDNFGLLAVRARPSGTFYVEIRSGDTRLGIDMFETVNEAARAYDAAACRLNRHRRKMNFFEMMTMEWAQNVTSRPRVVTDEDRCRNRRRGRRLSIAEMEEHAIAEWRRQFSQDILDEREFFARRRAEQATYREDRRTWKQAALFQMELKEASTWSSHDERCADGFITTEEPDTGASESDDDDEE
ncbi:Ethylene-responsive transcription factor CRF1 [Hordeum vulgare]|nr:Ethylene-responsive transcription factor CRF1 [Hordeum vulgare]